MPVDPQFSSLDRALLGKLLHGTTNTAGPVVVRLMRRR